MKWTNTYTILYDTKKCSDFVMWNKRFFPYPEVIWLCKNVWFLSLGTGHTQIICLLFFLLLFSFFKFSVWKLGVATHTHTKSVWNKFPPSQLKIRFVLWLSGDSVTSEFLAPKCWGRGEGEIFHLFYQDICCQKFTLISLSLNSFSRSLSHSIAYRSNSFTHDSAFCRFFLYTIISMEKMYRYITDRSCCSVYCAYVPFIALWSCSSFLPLAGFCFSMQMAHFYRIKQQE